MTQINKDTDAKLSSLTDDYADFKPTIPVGSKNINPKYALGGPHEVYTQTSGDLSAEEVEPTLHIWKTPAGHMFEMDDSGASTSASKLKTVENSGIRLSTVYGNILHMADDSEKRGICLRDSSNDYLWFDAIKCNCHLLVNNNYRQKIGANKTTDVDGMYRIHTKKSFSALSDELINISGKKGVLITTPLGMPITLNSDGGINIHAIQGVNFSSATKVTFGSNTEHVSGGMDTIVTGEISVTIDSKGLVTIKGLGVVTIQGSAINLVSVPI